MQVRKQLPTRILIPGKNDVEIFLTANAEVMVAVDAGKSVIAQRALVIDVFSSRTL